MTTEHLGVAFALKLPLAIALTKCDTVSEAALQALSDSIVQLLSNSQRKLVLITNIDQLQELLENENNANHNINTINSSSSNSNNSTTQCSNSSLREVYLP